MPGERDLGTLLATMSPRLKEGEWVFVDLEPGSPLVGAAMATVREPEGLSAVVARADADAAGLPYDFVAAWIILEVHSALDAVGLTAEVSRRLADLGISANVIAGLRHDHVLVPVDRADAALAALQV